MSELEPIDRQPESGEICPACAHTDSIIRETSTRALDAGDLVSVWVFGWLGFISALTGRTTVRLRCQHCNCRFARRTGFFSGLLWWIVLTVIATAPFAALATIGAPYKRGSQYVLDSVASVCEFGITHPLSILLAILIPALSAAMTVLNITINRRYERSQLIRAVAKRDHERTSTDPRA